jgi:hypothetical protein
MKNKDIVILKLASDDEIIGEMDDYTEHYISIKRPQKVILMRDPATGQPGKGMMDYLMLHPDVKTVYFYRSQMMIEPVLAPKETADVWRQQTSGIVLATQLNG